MEVFFKQSVRICFSFQKSVTVVTPEEQQIDLQSDLSFEVEDEGYSKFVKFSIDLMA